MSNAVSVLQSHKMSSHKLLNRDQLIRLIHRVEIRSRNFLETSNVVAMARKKLKK
jgi:hypothetical protein